MKGDTPTDSEIEILQVLWKLKEGTVREVHDNLGHDKSYTRTLKFMQIMQEKKLVRRLNENRPHRYEPTISKEITETSLLKKWMDKLTDGSVADFAMKALGSQKVTNDEIAQLRELLDQKEEENQK